MKRLLCAVLLMCAYASAQQINPAQIQPGTNGQQLCTVGGVSGWANCGGSAGAVLLAPTAPQTVALNTNGANALTLSNPNAGSSAVIAYELDNGTNQAAFSLGGTGNSSHQGALLSVNTPGGDFVIQSNNGPLLLQGSSTTIPGGVNTSPTDTGTANAYVAAVPACSSSPTFGTTATFPAANASTGASTFSWGCSETPATLFKNGSTNLTTGDILAGATYTVWFDGTNWQLLNSSLVGGSSAFSALTSGTNTSAAMLVGSGASLAPTGTGTIQATDIASTISAGTNVTITGAGTVSSPYLITSSATASTAFSALTGSTNTTAAMLVGTGASLAPTGSGAITANTLDLDSNSLLVAYGSSQLQADDEATNFCGADGFQDVSGTIEGKNPVISSVTVAAGTGTFTYAVTDDTLQVGNRLLLTGFTGTLTGLNNQIVTIASVGSGTFTGTVTGFANGTYSDSGSASCAYNPLRTAQRSQLFSSHGDATSDVIGASTAAINDTSFAATAGADAKISAAVAASIPIYFYLMPTPDDFIGAGNCVAPSGLATLETHYANVMAAAHTLGPTVKVILITGTAWPLNSTGCSPSNVNFTSWGTMQQDLINNYQPTAANLSAKTYYDKEVNAAQIFNANPSGYTGPDAHFNQQGAAILSEKMVAPLGIHYQQLGVNCGLQSGMPCLYANNTFVGNQIVQGYITTDGPTASTNSISFIGNDGFGPYMKVNGSSFLSFHAGTNEVGTVGYATSTFGFNGNACCNGFTLAVPDIVMKRLAADEMGFGTWDSTTDYSAELGFQSWRPWLATAPTGTCTGTDNRLIWSADHQLTYCNSGTGNYTAYGGGGGTPGGSTGNLQYNNAGVFGGDTSTNDDGAGNLSAKSYAATGSGAGQFNATEGTAPSAVSGHDILYADSTAHCMEYSANGGSFACLSTGGSSGVSSFTGDGVLLSNSASTGAVTATLETQTANTVFAGPSTGSAATPTFRALVSADLPTLPLSLNWTFNSGAAATDASPRFLANHTGTISNCYVLTTASDGSTALTFNIFDNGTTIFSSGAQTIAAATSPGTLTTISGLSITSITNNDKMSINITSGTSNWVFTVACK